MSITTVLLDAGPLGLATNSQAASDAVQCQQWIQPLDFQGLRIIIPEVTDCEVRRQLQRAGKMAGLRRLDALSLQYNYLPVTKQDWRQAALFWAQARQQRYQTADNKSLDADVILAAQAVTLGLPAGQVVIATTNVGHLARFTDAKRWQEIP